MQTEIIRILRVYVGYTTIKASLLKLILNFAI